jgi:hypothetical protein
MIFRIHIPKDSEQINLARRIRALLNIYKINNDTYEPNNASIGIKVYEILDKEILTQIIGLIQRSDYKITIIDNENKETQYV